MGNKVHKFITYTNKKGIVLLLACSAILFIYIPVFQNSFVSNWDDQWMVLENPYLHEFSFANIIAIFTESYGGQYSPLNTSLYLIITETIGMKPWAFHFMSLFLHCINFLLVGLFLKKLLDMIRDIDCSEKTSCYIAWGTAFLFAIHPMQVESVAWISASKVLLYSLFYLSGLLCYLYYRDTQERKYLWATLFLFLCALLSKEQAVVFILSLVAVDLVTLSRVKSKNVWLEKIPFVLLAALFSGFTLWLQQSSAGFTNTYPFYQRIAFAVYSLWEYLIKLLIPLGLSHFYFFPMDIGEAMPLRFWLYPVAGIIFGWLLFEYRRHMNNIHLFGGLFFLINLVLVLHLVPTARFAITADRYIYLSSIGFFLIIAYTFMQWLGKNNGRKEKVVLVVAGLYLLVLAGYTHQRTKVWKNMETLNRDVEQTVEKHMGDRKYLEKLQDTKP